MSSFYGNIKNGTQVSLIFDKTYSSRYEMEEAIRQYTEEGVSTGNINGDGVYNTRYVLVNYGERRYSPYHRINVNEYVGKVDNKEVLTDKCPELYIYQFNGTVLRQTTYGQIVENSMTREQRLYGTYEVYDKTKYAEDKSSRNGLPAFYVSLKTVSSNNNNNLVPDLIDENCEYALNRQVDEDYYQASYDHTVWQKIWCSVKNNTTITEKYIMVANLDAQAPKLNIFVDAPDDNDTYELVSKRYNDGTRVELPIVGSYYEHVGQDLGGEIYEPIDLKYIEAWNTYGNAVGAAQKALTQAKENVELKEDAAIKLGLVFDNNGVINETIYKDLRDQYTRLYEIEKNAGIADENNQYLIKLNEIIAARAAYEEAVETYDEAVAALKIAADKDYEALELKEIYSGPFFDYRECISDIVEWEDLVNEAGNQIITSKEILDSYIEHLGDIYRKEYISDDDDSTSYEILDKGSAYKMYSDNNNNIYHYYHRMSGEQGHISEELFNELTSSTTSGLWYYDEEENAILNARDTEYNKDTTYYQRVASDYNRGPHFDPLRSTDLDYKMHTPRNWKINTRTDFEYNAAGFDPSKQSYIKDAENTIYFKKTYSGEVYPVHMDTEGYMSLNENLSREEADVQAQIPEAGFYVNNNLQYAQQLDERKFDISFDEIGNVMSQLWDLVYPRGSFVKVETPSYEDEDFINGNYYWYDEASGKYFQVGKGDILDPDKTYYIFKAADADSTDADRYLFIGNDRDPDADYPQTLAELIRYVYKLLGLETDNDYRDVPSQETIWGMFNGLEELLGKFTDQYGLERFIPIRTERTQDINGTSQERVYYGRAGDIYFGNILSEEKYTSLNSAAFGPLYALKDTYPIWDHIVDFNTEDFDSTKVYYIKNDEGTYERADIEEFDTSVTYYIPTLLYEKASEYGEDVQYFRDMNSLWGLLREFQSVRSKYQADWTENVPGSPSFIQNRPSVIYSTEDDIDSSALYFNSYVTEDENDEPVLLPYLNGDEYLEELNINSQEDLTEAFENLEENQWITCYYMDNSDTPQYKVIIDSSEYNSDAEYYLIDKAHYDKLSHNIDDLWKAPLINPSDKETYIYDSEANINISYLTYQDILDIFDGSVYLLQQTDWYKAVDTGLDEISSIRFYLNYNPSASTLLESWDASRDQDESIVCYVEEFTDDNGDTTKILSITADGEKFVVHTNGIKFMPSDLITEGGDLKSIINLGYLDTSKATTMHQMFAGCTSIEKLDMSNFNTSNVTNMSEMFKNCHTLTSIDASGFDCSQVTDISSMFNGCSNVEEIKLPDSFDSVTECDSLFNGCTNLTTISGNAKMNLNNMLSTKSLFGNCTSLTSIPSTLLEAGEGEALTDISFMFSNCPNLTRFPTAILSLNTQNVTDMSNAFNGCSNASTALDLSNWDTSNVTNMDYLFTGSGIKELNLTGWDTSGVASRGKMTNMFSNMDSLDKITIGPEFVWSTLYSNSYLPDTARTSGGGVASPKVYWYKYDEDSSSYIGYTPTKVASMNREDVTTFYRGETVGIYIIDNRSEDAYYTFSLKVDGEEVDDSSATGTVLDFIITNNRKTTIGDDGSISSSIGSVRIEYYANEINWIKSPIHMITSVGTYQYQGIATGDRMITITLTDNYISIN